MPIVAIIALINEILASLPSLVSAGISIAGLVTQARTVLDATSAPDDPTWNAADQAVASYEAQLNVDPPAAAEAEPAPVDPPAS